MKKNENSIELFCESVVNDIKSRQQELDKKTQSGHLEIDRMEKALDAERRSWNDDYDKRKRKLQQSKVESERNERNSASSKKQTSLDKIKSKYSEIEKTLIKQRDSQINSIDSNFSSFEAQKTSELQREKEQAELLIQKNLIALEENLENFEKSLLDIRDNEILANTRLYLDDIDSLEKIEEFLDWAATQISTEYFSKSNKPLGNQVSQPPDCKSISQLINQLKETGFKVSLYRLFDIKGYKSIKATSKKTARLITNGKIYTRDRIQQDQFQINTVISQFVAYRQNQLERKKNYETQNIAAVNAQIDKSIKEKEISTQREVEQKRLILDAEKKNLWETYSVKINANNKEWEQKEIVAKKEYDDTVALINAKYSKTTEFDIALQDLESENSRRKELFLKQNLENMQEKNRILDDIEKANTLFVKSFDNNEAISLLKDSLLWSHRFYKDDFPEDFSNVPKNKPELRFRIGELNDFPGLSKELAEKFFPFIDRSNCNGLPVINFQNAPLALIYDYSKGGKELIESHIQLLILRIIRSLPKGSFSIHFFDPDQMFRLDQEEIFKGLPAENSFFYVHSFSDEIENGFRDLADFYKSPKISSLGVKSLYKRNQEIEEAGTGEKLPMHFIFIRNFRKKDRGYDEDNYYSRSSQYTRMLFRKDERYGTKAKQYGFSMIFLTDAGLDGLPDEIAKSDEYMTFTVTGENSKTGEADVNLKWKNYSFDKIKLDKISNYDRFLNFVDLVHEKITEPVPIQIDFEDVYSRMLSETPPYCLPAGNGWYDASEGMYLPIAVDQKTGEIIKYEIGTSDNVHGLLLGGAGAGKTTAFHDMINAICLQYSPDDVEIWIMDFKAGGDFTSYTADVIPPHIKLVTNVDSMDGQYACMQLINEEVERRKNILSASKSQNLSGYRDKGGKELTRLFILIDEFSTFSNGILNSKNRVGFGKKSYTEIFEEHMKKTRAYGITFVFADQTGLGGKQELFTQVNARLLMSKVNPYPGSSYNYPSQQEVEKFSGASYLSWEGGDVFYAYNKNHQDLKRFGKFIYSRSEKQAENLQKILEYSDKYYPQYRQKETKKPLIFIKDEENDQPEKFLRPNYTAWAKEDILHSDVKDGIDLLIGSRVSFSFYSRLQIKSSDNQSVLIYGNNIQYIWCVLLPMILSFLSYEDQNVCFVGEDDNFMMQKMRENFSGNHRFSFLTEVEDVITLVNKVSEKNDFNTLVIWFEYDKYTDKLDDFIKTKMREQKNQTFQAEKTPRYQMFGTGENATSSENEPDARSALLAQRKRGSKKDDTEDLSKIMDKIVDLVEKGKGTSNGFYNILQVSDNQTIYKVRKNINGKMLVLPEYAQSVSQMNNIWVRPYQTLLMDLASEEEQVFYLLSDEGFENEKL